MLRLVNAFLKTHRKELGLKGYSKMKYLEKLDYLKSKTKGTKYEREIAKFTKPKVDEGIKKVLDKSGRGKNVRVKREKKEVDRLLDKELKALHTSKPSWKNMDEKQLLLFIKEKYGDELTKRKLFTSAKGSGVGFRLKVQKSSIPKIKEVVPAEIVDKYLELFKKRRGK
jgi:hypothetical protein